MIDFIKKFQFHFFGALSILLGFTPILWFKGYLIAGEEFYAIDYEKWGKLFSYGWSNALNFGEHSILFPFRFQQYFFALLRLIGINYYYSLIFWHVFLWTLTSFGFYLFLNSLFKKSIQSYILFLGTVLYLFNPFFLNITVLLSPPRILFAALPLLGYFGMKYIENSKEDYLSLFLCNIIIYFSSPVFVNLPYGVMLLVFPILGIFFRNIIKSYDSFLFIKHLLFFVFLFLLLNLWWLIPTFSKIINNVDEIQDIGSSFVTIQNTHISDVLNFSGSWAFREKIGGYDYLYFPYSVSFDKFPLVFFKNIPYFIIGFGFLGLFKLKNNTYQKLILFHFGGIFLIFTFLSKGTNGIFGGLFNYLYENFPFFWVFREPYSKFMPIATFCGAIFFVYGISTILEFISNSKVKYKIFFSLIILLLINYSLVSISKYFFSKDIIWNINDNSVRSYHINPSDSWTHLIKNWQPTKNGYYMLFPSSGFTERLLWKSGYSGNAFLMMTTGHFINPISGYIENKNTSRVIAYLYKQLFENPTKFKNLSEKYNLSGFIFQGESQLSDSMNNRDSLRNDYNSALTFTNEKTDVYEFNSNLDTLKLIPNELVYTLHKENFDLFSNARVLVPDNVYFRITDNNNDLINELNNEQGFFFLEKAYENKNDKSTLYYNISVVPNGEYTLIFDNEFLNVQNIYTDNNQLEFIEKDKLIYVKYTKIPTCCNQLKLKFNSLTEPIIYDDWISYDIKNNKEVSQQKTNKLDISIPNISYLKKIDNFKMEAQYQVILQGNYKGQLPVNAQIIQKDLDSNTMYPIYSTTINSISGAVQFILDGKKANINTSKNSEYYLLIQKVLVSGLNEEVIEGVHLEINDIKILQIFEPNILVSKGDFQSRKDDLQQYKEEHVNNYRHNEYILLGEFEEINKNNKSIIFKESYSNEWRLLPITTSQNENLRDDINFFDKLFLLLNLKNSLKPSNIEYYANSWEINNSYKSNKFIIYFLPAIVSDVFLPVSIITIIAFSTVFVLKKYKYD